MAWPPWFLRWVLLTFALFVQLLIVADLLGALDDDPNLELDYVLIFGVTILYLSAAGLMLLFSWFTALRLFIDVRREAVSEAIATSTHEDINRREAMKRDLRIVVGDVVVDTLLFVPLVVFVALLIDNLQRINDGEPMRNWEHVFAWLFVVFIILSVVVIVTAIRTCGEERLRRGDMGSGQWASSAFGDVVVGVSVDGTVLQNARGRRADKSEDYVADANYHAIPCAYLCTPQLTGNWYDFLLNWALFATLLYLAVLSLQLGVHVQRHTWRLQPLLILGWILAAIVFIFAVAALLLMCFDPRVAGTKALPRFSIVQKMNLALIAALGALLIAIFGALLVEKIDHHNDDLDWWAIFAPLLIFTGLVLITSACYGSALRKPPPQYVDITASTTTTTTQTSARANVAKRDLSRNINPLRTSVWGI